MKAFFYTAFALAAFALNSILCRLALGTEAADAAGFTAVRLISGGVALVLIGAVFGEKQTEKKKRGNWISAFFLFAYAICFSFAYVSLTTATGALILFGSVQATMISAAFVAGEKPSLAEWLGLTAAIGGLIYLVFPGLSAPPLFSSALMVFAGVSWGFYTLRGRGSADPLGETTGNFVRSIPMVILISLPFASSIHLSAEGLAFAVLSGAIASGIGYAVWYRALQYHTATRAAILQLAVPIIAAFGGVIFLAETISRRLVLAAVIILGGILTAIAGRKYGKNKG